LRCVTDGLEVDSIMGLDTLMDEREVTLDDDTRRGGVTLPALRALLDIREEEGHGAGWELRHASSPEVQQRFGTAAGIT
jgi:hypothetical protein